MSKRLILAAIPLLAIMMLVLPVSAACTATFTATPTSGNAPLTVTFTSTSTCDAGDAVATYLWTFGDGVTDAVSGATATHIYTTNGPFSATLSTTNTVAPVATVTSAATTITPIFGKAVTPAQTVFIGEQGLDISAAVPAAQIAWFAAGSSPAADAPSKIITPDKTNFYVSPSDFGSYTGAWYNWGGASPAGAVAFYVQVSSLDIKIWNADTNKVANDISIIRPGSLTFRIDNNLYPAHTERQASGFLTIKIKDTAGATLTQVFTNAGVATSLTGIPTFAGTLSSQQFLGATATTPVWGTGYKPGTSNFYAAGTYEVWVESNLNGMKDNLGSVTGQTVSTHHTITIADNQATITANTDTVVRGNEFSISISGRPNGVYALWVSGTGGQTTGAPIIKDGQAGVSVGAANVGTFVYSGTGATPTVASDSKGTQQYASVTLDDSGKRTVGISTDANTDDKTYTFRVSDLTDNTIYDTVKVSVTKGAVTVDAEGSKVYFVGQDVKLFGENTDSDNVYLFITGPNIASNGARLDATDYTTGVTDNVPGTFLSRVVKSDNTWDYTWGTANVPLDAGTYTIYAVSQPRDKDHLSFAKYATVSIQLRKPFVNASLPSSRIAKGDKFTITGTAEGKPGPGLEIWILGTNLARVDSVSVADDNTFEYTIDQGVTSNWAAGQYFVVVQHPMYNNQFDIIYNPATGEVTNRISGIVEFHLTGAGRLQGSDAAEALVTALDSPNVDDTYTRLFFLLEEPFINIDAISDKTVGETFTITGTTNLAVDDTFLVTVTSSSFQPTQKTTGGEFSGVSGSTTVVKGTGVDNTWSFDVDTTGFKPDQYIVTVEAVETSTTATTTFFVSEVPPTTVTTQPPATTTTVPATTTVPPTTTTVPPTTTPGFGAVIALIGLGAVAVLVLRRH